jgi:NAD(P)-dependent dehydrogenase (short-subunit alcohol dehydrogenase family)
MSPTRTSTLNAQEAEREAVQTNPIGRMVMPEDIADLILFLVSERASAITGQVIAVDGGAVGAYFIDRITLSCQGWIYA